MTFSTIIAMHIRDKWHFCFLNYTGNVFSHSKMVNNKYEYHFPLSHEVEMKVLKLMLQNKEIKKNNCHY